MEEAFDEWRRLRESGGGRVTIIDLYELVARPRGLAAHELPLEERQHLARAALEEAWSGFTTTPGSERPFDPIEITEYDPSWPDQFERWRETIAGALGEAARRIEHVGSTSVPGIPAKAVIDVQVSVSDLERESDYVGQLESVGLQLRSRDAVRRFFRPFPDRPRDVHVHVCAVGSEWEREHLLFRDYLRAHPRARDEYAAAKHRAAAIWADDRIAYTEAKTDTILGIMAEAERWAARPQ